MNIEHIASYVFAAREFQWSFVLFIWQFDLKNETHTATLPLLFKLKLLLNKSSTQNFVWKRMTWRLMVVLTSRYYLYQIVWHPNIWNMTLMVLANWIEDELTGPKFCTSHKKVTNIPVIINHRSISVFIFEENSFFCITLYFYWIFIS